MKTANGNANQIRQALLELVHAQPGLSTAQIATALSLSPDTAKKVLATLERKGFVSHLLASDRKGRRAVWRALRDFDSKAFKQGTVRQQSRPGVIVHRCDDSKPPYRNQGGQCVDVHIPRASSPLG